MERLQAEYTKTMIPQLMREFGYKNSMQAPKVTKITVNVGVGKNSRDAKFMEAVLRDVAKISGQFPVKTSARKSIAGFKVRQGQIVGVSVTLRGARMYSFLDKLINVTLPRVRDFRGVSLKGFDGRGNYHLGIKEHLVFPEISADSLEHSFGLQVSIVTNARADAPAKALLSLMKFPFNKQ